MVQCHKKATEAIMKELLRIPDCGSAQNDQENNVAKYHSLT
jgi:hypothetical protein